MLLCTWKDTFIKFSPFRDDILLCRGIVELPAFVTTGITNKHALFHVGLKKAVLVLLNEDICQASPNAKMGDIWFALEPDLIGSGTLERGCRKTIPDMDLGTESFSQK